MSRFGLYVHIPYCLQICTYCDFVKFEAHELPPADEYISLLEKELAVRTSAFRDSLWPNQTPLHSIYFGGGTPSLFNPTQILAILSAIAKNGFVYDPRNIEITLEINPGTITAESLRQFLAIGINRFSVGAQTFDERTLSLTGRKHTVQDTVETLELLATNSVNYSFDLLFGLPEQSVEDVSRDVRRAIEFRPSHLSAYNLTVPTGHPLNRGRAPDDQQAEMFLVIEEELRSAGLFCYELSNFAKPGFESQHNLLYWSDGAYWGLGIGSHSYLPNWFGAKSAWGVRFWNPATIAAYRSELEKAHGPAFWAQFAKNRNEVLTFNELLTDFSHTSLRRLDGMTFDSIYQKFDRPMGDRLIREFELRLAPLLLEGLVQKLEATAGNGGGAWRITPKGRPLANRVFEALTFLKADKVCLL